MTTTYSIPVYPGIGDNPIPPSPISYGNSDYFIGKFNTFVDYVVTERGNKMTTILTTTLSLYIDSLDGDDVTGTGSSTTPYKSLSAVIKHLDDREIGIGIGGELRLILSGVFSEIDLYYLPVINNTRRAKVTLEGDYVIELSDKDWRLNPFASYEIKGGIVTISGVSSITDVKMKWGVDVTVQFNNNNTKLYIDKCDLELDGCILTNNFVNNPLEITNTIVNIKNVSINTSEVNGFLLSMGVGVMAFLESMVATYDNVEKLNLIRCTYGCRLYINNIEQLTILKINYGGMAYQDIFYSNLQDRAKYIVNLLNSLGENDKLPLSAIKQYEDIVLPTPEGIKSQLATLSGEDRLDSSHIKNLDNYNSFSSVVEGFTQPAVNSQVTIRIGDTRWLQSGQYVKISGGGIYLIQTVVDSEYLVIKNTGDISNVNEGVICPVDSVITLTGKSGFSGFTTTTTALQQPAVGESILVSLSNGDSIITNSIIHIEGSDYYKVTNIVRATQQITCVRLGYLLDVEEGSNILSGTRVVVAGVQGIPGNGAYCYITETFTTPQPYQNVTIKVTNTDFIVEGNWVFIYEVGYYEVIDVVDDLTLVLKNTGVTDNLVPDAEVYSPRKLINSSKPGESSFSITKGVMVVPEIGDSNAVFVDQVSWMRTGFNVSLNGAFYEIGDIDFVSKTVFLKNLSDQSVGTSIPENSLIILSGQKGEKGDKGDTGNFYQVTTQELLTPSIGDTVNVFVSSTELFTEGMYVTLQGVQGTLQVYSVVDNNELILYNFNALDDITVPIDSRISVYGSPNLDNIHTLPFIQPNIGASVLVETKQPTLNFVPNSFCFISGAGYYLVESVGDFSLMLRNDYHGENVISGTSIPDSVCKPILGLPKHTIFKLSSTFIQPNADFVATTSFDNFRYLNIGDILRSPNNGYYFVENISTSTPEVFLKNLAYGFSDEKTPGEQILSNSLFYLSPPRGETGYNSNFTHTINSFLQPPVGSVARVFVQDVQFFIAGQYIAIENGGSSYVITDILSSNEIEVKNLGWDNVLSPTNIPSGSKITSSGYVKDINLYNHELMSRISSINHQWGV